MLCQRRFAEFSIDFLARCLSASARRRISRKFLYFSRPREMPRRSEVVVIFYIYLLVIARDFEYIRRFVTRNGRLSPRRPICQYRRRISAYSDQSVYAASPLSFIAPTIAFLHFRLDRADVILAADYLIFHCTISFAATCFRDKPP